MNNEWAWHWLITWIWLRPSSYPTSHCMFTVQLIPQIRVSPCVRVLLYRKRPVFFSSLLLLSLEGCFFFPQTNEMKTACLDFFAFPSIYQAEHLVNKGNGLPVGMHKSAIPQTSVVTAALRQREKHGGQNGISLCVPALFSRLKSLPPKHAYHGSQTYKTDTFICLNPHPPLPSFHPKSLFVYLFLICFKTEGSGVQQNRCPAISAVGLWPIADSGARCKSTGRQELGLFSFGTLNGNFVLFAGQECEDLPTRIDKKKKTF